LSQTEGIGDNISASLPSEYWWIAILVRRNSSCSDAPLHASKFMCVKW